MELGKRGFVNVLLGLRESLKIERIAHQGMMDLSPFKGKSGWRLSGGRQQSGKNVKEDHDGAGQQSCNDEPQADDRWVEAGIIGKTSGDAHDLCVAAVDQETSIHMKVFQIQNGVQAIGSEVAAETRRSAEMNAPAKTVAVWRTDANEVNIGNPFSFFIGPAIGPVP